MPQCLVEATDRWFRTTQELWQVNGSYRAHHIADQETAERNRSASYVSYVCCDFQYRHLDVSRDTEERPRKEVRSLCKWEQAGKVATVLAELRTGC